MDIVERIHIYRNESSLGQWSIALCRPAPDLFDLIQAMWLGEGRVNYAVDRILPTGSSHLLINLGPPQYLVDPVDPQRRRVFADIWYSGPQHGPLDTAAPHGQRLLGIAFQPAGARPWLGLDAVDSANQVLGLIDVLGADAASLHRQLLDDTTAAACFARVESWLRRRRQPRWEVSPAVAWSLRRLAEQRGQLSIEALRGELGCSRNHLAQLFRRQVGLAPKTLARLYRFNDALRLLRGRSEVPWAELAQLCGYYDQSHLIRDFREFSGLAPGDFICRPQPDSTSIVVR